MRIEAGRSLADKLGGWPGIIGYVVGIFGIAATIFYYYRSRQYRLLDWRLTAAQPVLRHLRGKSDARLLIGTSEIKSPNVIAIQFINTGTQDIPNDEFDEVLTVNFGNIAKVTHWLPVDSSSAHVYRNGNVNTSDDGSSVTITDIGLLKQGEWFEIQFVTSGPLDAIQCSARFEGQRGQCARLVRQQILMRLPRRSLRRYSRSRCAASDWPQFDSGAYVERDCEEISSGARGKHSR